MAFQTADVVGVSLKEASCLSCGASRLFYVTDNNLVRPLAISSKDYDILSSGTIDTLFKSSSVTLRTITLVDAKWVVDEHKGKTLYRVRANGEIRESLLVHSNTEDTLTITSRIKKSHRAKNGQPNFAFELLKVDKTLDRLVSEVFGHDPPRMACLGCSDVLEIV